MLSNVFIACIKMLKVEDKIINIPHVLGNAVASSLKTLEPGNSQSYFWKFCQFPFCKLHNSCLFPMSSIPAMGEVEGGITKLLVRVFTEKLGSG